MPIPKIITHQPVGRAKLARAREFRHCLTPAERLLWQHLRNNQLRGLHFRRQQVIAGFIVDFYCHPARLVVEVDGPIHAAQAADDQERDRVLASLGLHILRVTNDDVLQDTAGVLERIARAADLTP